MALEFDENTHTYRLNGKKLISVTTFIKAFFSEFNEREIIPELQKSVNSPYFMKSTDEIKAMWKAETEAGTKLHKDIEDYYNGIEVWNDSIEFEYFIKFCNDHQDLKPIKTELKVYSETWGIAGTIDMIYKKGEGLVLCDWKRAKNIRTEGYGKVAGYPIEKIPDSNFYKYALQLNVYKMIIEGMWGNKVKEMILVQLHPNNDGYRVFVVPNMQDEVKKMIEATR